MQKKAVGIMVGVVATHALLLGGVLLSGGCKHPEILGTRDYETGPSPSTGAATTETAAAPAATEVPAAAAPAAAPAPVEVPATPKTQLPGLDSIPAVPASAAAVGSETYTVKSGDTLSGIAYRYGIKTQALAAANDLTLKSVLKIGQKLQLPAGAVYHPERAKKTASQKAAAAKAPQGQKAAASTAAVAEGGIYTVKSGDTLGKIGHKFHVSAAAIAKANNISVKKVLQIGDKLVIPSADGSVAAAAPAAAVSTTVPAAATTTATPAAADPFAGIDAAAPTAAPAATPAAADPFASIDATAPAATPAAVPETVPSTTPAAIPAEAPAATEATEVQDDTTVEAFCRANGYKQEDIVRLNPDLPADGKIRRGQFLVVPNL